MYWRIRSRILTLHKKWSFPLRVSLIRSYLLMKSLMDNFIFCAVCSNSKSYLGPYLSHKYTFVTYYKNWFIQLFLAVLDMFSPIQILMVSPHLLTSFMMMLSLSQTKFEPTLSSINEFGWLWNCVSSKQIILLLRILTGKTHSQINLKRLRKVWIWVFG